MAWASQSNGAATRDAAASPAVSHTDEIMGTSHTPTGITPQRSSRLRWGQTCWPTFQKKLISVTDAPQITAAPQATRTPILPRPARRGLEELAPQPHTIAEMISARTDRMRLMVMTALTCDGCCVLAGGAE